MTPEGLDRAALENSVGGPFYPGIEVSWLVRDPVGSRVVGNGPAEGRPEALHHLGFELRPLLPWMRDERVPAVRFEEFRQFPSLLNAEA